MSTRAGRPPADVEVTRPDKLLWPQLGVTKRVYVDYLDAVAADALPWLRDRPLTLVRAPDGVGGKRYFQKAISDYAPPWIPRVHIEAPSAGRDGLRRLQRRGDARLDRQPGRARAAPGPGAHGSPGSAGPAGRRRRPPDDAFDAAVEVVRLVLEVLGDHGLESGVKTTGGKGLHVVIPIERRVDADRRGAAANLTAIVSERRPALVTDAFRKAARKGRVMLDPSRNGTKATIVALYRLGPGVKAPCRSRWCPRIVRGATRRSHVVDRAGRARCGGATTLASPARRAPAIALGAPRANPDGMSDHVLTNGGIGELLLRAAREESGHRRRALERAARSARFWPEEAADLATASRSLTELRAVGPWVASAIHAWLDDPPSRSSPTRPGTASSPTPRRRVLDAAPAWEATLHGDLQVHSTDSDGALPLADMASAARTLGRSFIASTDHSKSLRIAHGMDEAQLARHNRLVDECNASFEQGGDPFRILRSIEMDVLDDGSGDMDPDSLETLDLVLGAFHTKLRVTDDATERYLAGLRTRRSMCWRIRSRACTAGGSASSADWPRVFTEAAALGKAVEIDATPARQDPQRRAGLVASPRACAGSRSGATRTRRPSSSSCRSARDRRPRGSAARARAQLPAPRRGHRLGAGAPGARRGAVKAPQGTFRSRRGSRYGARSSRVPDRGEAPHAGSRFTDRAADAPPRRRLPRLPWPEHEPADRGARMARRAAPEGDCAGDHHLTMCSTVASSCSAAPRWAPGRSAHRCWNRLAGAVSLDADVVVVGAGLAGLTCTYRLRGTAFGPCSTRRRIASGDDVLRSATSSSPARRRRPAGSSSTPGTGTSDRWRGARVPLVDTFAQSVPTGSQSYRWLHGALRSDDEVFAKFGVFIERLERAFRRAGSYRWNQAGPEAERIDRTTMIEWFDAKVPGGSKGLLGRALGVFMQSFFGMEPAEMSTINLFEAFVVPYPGANERYRVAGGNDRSCARCAGPCPTARSSARAPCWRRVTRRTGASPSGSPTPPTARWSSTGSCSRSRSRPCAMSISPACGCRRAGAARSPSSRWARTRSSTCSSIGRSSRSTGTRASRATTRTTSRGTARGGSPTPSRDASAHRLQRRP